MKNTRVKICGITTVEDARYAVDKGADYIGLIFAESLRRVDVERAAEIRAAVPGARIVGVFLDAPIDEVVETTAATGLNLIQLHGDESPEYCAEVQTRTSTPIIKAFTDKNLPDTAQLSAYETTSYFLFDLDKKSLEDDALTEAIDRMWHVVARKRAKGFRVFLAGALDESNVRHAIERTHAYCVDVCRGVERAPGLKDRESLERFIAEVKA